MNGSSFCCINNNNNRRNPKRNEFPYFDLILLYCRGREIVCDLMMPNDLG
jgi:hypothetical protein